MLRNPSGSREKFFISGQCVEVIRRVGVEEVAARRKEHRLVQIKIDCDSGGKVMVDEEVVVVDDD
jgi:hypothetical protein